MNISEISIKRPVFITCLLMLLMVIGLISLFKLPVDLFPNVTFPVIVVNTEYPGAVPEEIETIITKVLEDELINTPGLKKLRSNSTESTSQIIAEFNADTDIKYVEQQIRDKVNLAKIKLPKDVQNPTIWHMDPADSPVMIVSVKSNLPTLQLYDYVNNIIKPKLEQISQVAKIDLMGSSEREIHVNLDRNKLYSHNLSASIVANRIASFGQNFPVGKVDQGNKEKLFRSVGEYHSIKDIGSVPVNFTGNDVPITVNNLGTVTDSIADETSRTYVDGKRGMLMMLFKQSGANTIAVVKATTKKIAEINHELTATNAPLQLTIVRDGSRIIHANVNDVVESIILGIILTNLVVFLFLGSIRSTLITGIALPTSLLGAFFLMHLAGFTINTMSLLALSLSVGLLVDDAIIVRENIFRHCELGKNRFEAAIHGTKEILLAVVATTLTIIAVFGPIGFLHGIVGSFFKEFGLTVCFAMMVSLLDAITMAPMLSAYIGLRSDRQKEKGILYKINLFQNKLENFYEKFLYIVLRFPLTILCIALGIFILSLVSVKYIPKTFVPTPDNGEFIVNLSLPPGTNLATTDSFTKKVDSVIRANKEVASSVAIVGSQGESNSSLFYVNMVPSNKRKITTSIFEQRIRDELKEFSMAKIVVSDIDLTGGSQRAFNLAIKGDNLDELKKIATNTFNIIKNNKILLDPVLSDDKGKEELKIIPIQNMVEKLGMTTTTLGQELHALVSGETPAVYRENGQEYKIRVRLMEEQRDLQKDFSKILVPNMNNTLVELNKMSNAVSAFAPTNINRENRQRYIVISGDLLPKGLGMPQVMKQIETIFKDKVKLPLGVSYKFEGEAESFAELIHNMVIAIALGILFIYLVLASLYESFIMPFAIMLVLPLAACGAFFALFITRHSLDIFSMIGCILLFGIATKNSILLVDYTRQMINQGYSRQEAIIKAGRTRLRPILMTSIALIAGMLPIAIGLNEASKQRMSMGIAVVGGILSSTLLTLVVVPAAYGYIDRFSSWSSRLLKKLVHRK